MASATTTARGAAITCDPAAAAAAAVAGGRDAAAIDAQASRVALVDAAALGAIRRSWPVPAATGGGWSVPIRGGANDEVSGVHRLRAEEDSVAPDARRRSRSDATE
eukprot:6182407-Pleurochrysis_carterae.AAC.4